MISTQVAGFVSNTLRDDGRVELLVAGPSAINTALKAVCVARDFLEKDNLDIDLVPRFSQFNERKNEVVLAMVTRRRRLLEDDAPILREFRVASSTAPHGVAAPMCAALKHHERIVVTAMGAQCVTMSMPLPSESPATAAALRSMSSTTLESLAESP